MELGDYNSISKDVNWTTVKYTQMLPFAGSSWYWKGACEYMMENNIVRWEHIAHTLTATAHLPHDYVRPIICNHWKYAASSTL